MRESKSRALPLGDTPVLVVQWKNTGSGHARSRACLGWVKGLEPSTPGTTIRCSNQLSYTHQIYGIQNLWKMARQKGFEPLACCLEGSCSIQLSYWRIVERVTRIELASPAWKAGALAIVLHPRMGQLSALVVPQQQIISLPIIAHRSPFVNIFFTKFSPPRFLAEKHLHSLSK